MRRDQAGRDSANKRVRHGRPDKSSQSVQYLRKRIAGKAKAIVVSNDGVIDERCGALAFERGSTFSGEVA